MAPKRGDGTRAKKAKSSSSSNTSKHKVSRSNATGSSGKSGSASSVSGGKSSKSSSKNSSSSGGAGGGASLPSSGFLLTCDVPTKQFIKHMNEKKSVDKQFILEDLDSTHLLIKGGKKYKEEIMNKVNQWMDDNVFTLTERIGENLDTS